MLTIAGFFPAAHLYKSYVRQCTHAQTQYMVCSCRVLPTVVVLVSSMPQRSLTCPQALATVLVLVPQMPQGTLTCPQALETLVVLVSQIPQGTLTCPRLCPQPSSQHWQEQGAKAHANLAEALGDK